MSEEEIEEIEEKYWRGESLDDDLSVRARKKFGQHFLEPAWADKVVAAIAPRATIGSSKSGRAPAR